MFSHRDLGTLTVGDPGDEAQAKRGILKITYPVDHGIVQDAMSPPLCSCDTKLYKTAVAGTVHVPVDDVQGNSVCTYLKSCA